MRLQRQKSIFAATIGSFLSFGVAYADDKVDYGEYLSGECKNCHVLKGESKGDIPSLEGFDGETIADALNAYRKGERKDASEAMKSVAAALDDEQVAALAEKAEEAAEAKKK